MNKNSKYDFEDVDLGPLDKIDQKNEQLKHADQLYESRDLVSNTVVPLKVKKSNLLKTDDEVIISNSILRSIFICCR